MTIPGASLLSGGSQRIVLVTDRAVHLSQGQRYDKPRARLGSYPLSPTVMAFDGGRVSLPDGRGRPYDDYQAQTLAWAAGIDHIVPADSRPLAEEIVDAGGALISRNRKDRKGSLPSSISAGRTTTALAQALILTAASDEDGAMAKAADAARLGRAVMVADLGDDDDGEGLRTLLSAPANQLHERLRVWRSLGSVAEGLGEDPLAERISPEAEEDLLAALERAAERESGAAGARPWWPGLGN